MALRFMDSVAHYNGTYIPAKWTNQFLVSYSATGGRRNASYIGGPGSVTKTLTHGTRFIQGAAIIHGALRGNSLWLGNNNSNIMQLTMNGDSTMSILANTVVIGHSAIAVPDPQSWHYYEVDSTIGAAGSFVSLTASLRVDGISYGSFSGVSNIGTGGLIDGAATANQVGLNLGTNGYMDYYCVDANGTDLYGQTTTNTTFLGDVEIDAIFPGTDVSTGWGTVGGDGTHAYTCVNDNPPDADTSYILTSSTASSEGFNYTPITGFTGTILGAQYLTFARKDAEGSRVIAMTVGTHTATNIEFLGTGAYLSDYYIYYIAPLDSDFGVAWTNAVLATETFGVKLLS
jgi:hypothetical protein